MSSGIYTRIMFFVCADSTVQATTTATSATTIASTGTMQYVCSDLARELDVERS